MIPQYVMEELKGTKRYYDEHKRCVFCDILEQECREQKRIISQNEDFVCLTPFAPRYPFECWLVPKHHSSQFASIAEAQQLSLACLLKEVLSRIKICLSNPSYNFFLHISPINDEGKESYHWHMEVIPRLTQFSGFEWGSGFNVVRTSPEVAAQYLREVAWSVKTA